MKTRSKLLLAAVSLLTVSVAATATSAYAWYTANRQVSAKLTQMGVQATSGTLSIAHAEGVEDSFSDGGVELSNYNLTATATGKALTDVSSKGDGSFIKPKFSHDNTTIVGEYGQNGKDVIGQKTVTLSNGVVGDPIEKISAYGVISLAITITNSGESNVAGAIDVYIDPTGTNFSSDLTSATNSARFSIIEVGSSNSVYMYCSPTTTTVEQYNYLKRGDNESISLATLQDTTDGFIQDKTSGKLFAKTGVVASSSSTTKTKSNGYLCQLDAGSSKTYLITMWVEGTDPDCKVKINDSTPATSLEDSILVENLSLTLGLYALEA